MTATAKEKQAIHKAIFERAIGAKSKITKQSVIIDANGEKKTKIETITTEAAPDMRAIAIWNELNSEQAETTAKVISKIFEEFDAKEPPKKTKVMTKQ